MGKDLLDAVNDALEHCDSECKIEVSYEKMAKGYPPVKGILDKVNEETDNRVELSIFDLWHNRANDASVILKLRNRRQQQAYLRYFRECINDIVTVEKDDGGISVISVSNVIQVGVRFTCRKPAEDSVESNMEE